MMKKIIQLKKNNPKLMNFSKMMTNPMKLMFKPMMKNNNEKDVVNGNENDQVKTEELFESIAIFLFSPFYKFRKKRWEPGKLDQ